MLPSLSPLLKTTRVEVIFKDANSGTIRCEYPASTVKIKNGFLLLISYEKDSENKITRVFNLNEVNSFKEYRETITTK